MNSWLLQHLVDAVLTAGASALGAALVNARVRRRLRRLSRALWAVRTRVGHLEVEHAATRAHLLHMQEPPRSVKGTS